MQIPEKQLSFRQKKAIDAYVRNGGRSMGAALLEADYSMAIVRQPRKVFSSPLVVAELRERGYFSGKREEYGKMLPMEEVPDFDVSKIPKEDIRLLKEKLEALLGEPLLLHQPPVDEISSTRIPQGTGVDIFSVEGTYGQEFDRGSGFSSM